MGRLTDKYCIVGVGETSYSKNSGKTTRAMGAEAIRNAMRDAGLRADQVNGVLSYHGGDSTGAPEIAADLGIRPDFYMDCSGGGSSTEALVGLAIGAIEVGMCETVAIFRSMNGYSEVRIGGTGRRAAAPVAGSQLLSRPYGMVSAGQNFAPVFMRHMMEYGTTSAQVAAVKVAHSKHASNNPKAFYRKRYTVEDVLNSRWICKPLHLLDCCVETDNATALIVTSAQRAVDMRSRPVYVMGVVGRVTKKRGDTFYNDAPITDVAGKYAAERVFGMAGIGPRRRARDRVVRRLHLHHHAAAGGLRVLPQGGGRRVRVERHDRARRQAAQQYQRRPPLRGLHAWHEHGHRERPAVARAGRRFLPRMAGRPPHL